MRAPCLALACLALACAGPSTPSTGAAGPPAAGTDLAAGAAPTAAQDVRAAESARLEALVAAARERLETPSAPALGPHSLAGLSLEGRPLPVHVLGDGPRSVLLMATIHGDEAAGTPLLERLVEHLRGRPGLAPARRVIVLPVVNPDGLAAGRRTNARGVDLNRNFPASNRSDGRRGGEHALSEPESRALAEVLERYEPELVVSFHGWVGQVDWDGPAAELAARMGSLCGLPARRLGSRPGSLGSHLGLDRGVPTITFEFPHDARGQDGAALWERYGEAVLAAVTWPGSARPES